MKLSKKVHFNIFATAIFAASIVVALFTGISVIYILIVSAILGLLYGFLNSVKEAKIDVSNPS
ncbi:MAG TPA: hypothetical protein DEG42_06245 [Acholeplasmataceae bacterium]|nr:hypothetical protein [Acholeplasmataceae bacterium]